MVLNIRALLHDKTLMREVVQELKDTAEELDGDIGRISKEKIILVPTGMRISHRGS